MKTGRVFRKFALGDSRKVVLREAERRDLEKLLAFINGLVSEKRRDESSQLFTGFESRFRKRQEAEWLDDLVRRTQKGDTVSVLAEVDGEIVGNGEITRARTRRRSITVISHSPSEERTGVWALDGRW